MTQVMRGGRYSVRVSRGLRSAARLGSFKNTNGRFVACEAHGGSTP